MEGSTHLLQGGEVEALRQLEQPVIARAGEQGGIHAVAEPLQQGLHRHLEQVERQCKLW